MAKNCRPRLTKDVVEMIEKSAATNGRSVTGEANFALKKYYAMGQVVTNFWGTLKKRGQRK